MTDDLIKFMHKRYIENGYMYSGCATFEMIHVALHANKTDVTRKVIQEAVELKLIEPRGDEGAAWGLPLDVRKQLIQENNLSETWEKNASYFDPNGKYGEVTQVMSEK